MGVRVNDWEHYCGRPGAAHGNNSKDKVRTTRGRREKNSEKIQRRNLENYVTQIDRLETK